MALQDAIDDHRVAVDGLGDAADGPGDTADGLRDAVALQDAVVGLRMQ